MESSYRNELIEAGFASELPSISRHDIQVQHDGKQYTKRFPAHRDHELGDGHEEYEIGVYINPTYGGMQVFGCICTLACCGEEVTEGITPYNFYNLIKLIHKFIVKDQECKLGFKRH